MQPSSCGWSSDTARRGAIVSWGLPAGSVWTGLRSAFISGFASDEPSATRARRNSAFAGSSRERDEHLRVRAMVVVVGVERVRSVRLAEGTCDGRRRSGRERGSLPQEPHLRSREDPRFSYVLTSMIDGALIVERRCPSSVLHGPMCRLAADSSAESRGGAGASRLRLDRPVETFLAGGASLTSRHSRR